MLASPPRWSWICSMAEKLITKRPKKAIDGAVMAAMKAQSDLLEDRAAAPQLRALKAHRLHQRRRDVRMALCIKQMHRKAAQVTERALREERRVQKLRQRRELFGSPQPAPKFARDTLGRVHLGSR
jgi:hypothetical protein